MDHATSRMAYKAAQEAFVSNHEGTTMAEVSLVVSVLPVTLWAYSYDGASRVGAFVNRLATVLLPVLVAFTFTQYTPLVLAASVARAVAHRWAAPAARARGTRARAAARARGPLPLCERVPRVHPREHVRRDPRRRLPHLPRRFAKTETYGTGLMDVGVGGLRSARSSSPSARRARVALRRALPLLALGAATLAGKRGVDYQQHVSEYGVHWNFFFTLAGVALGGRARPRSARRPRCARGPARSAAALSRRTRLCSRAAARATGRCARRASAC